VLTLNPGGRIDDGTNIVTQSNSFVKTADLSGSILTALNKNIETLAATDAGMKVVMDRCIKVDYMNLIPEGK
jgi:hypothetical protein